MRALFRGRPGDNPFVPGRSVLRFRFWAAVLSVAVATGGCVHLQARKPVSPADLPVEEVLSDLDRNAEALDSLTANFTLLTKVEGQPRRRFQGQMRYRRPEELYLAAWAVPLGQRAFEVVSRGLYGAVYVPAEESYFVPPESDPASDAFDVWVLARRTVSQEAWRGLRPDQVTVVTAGERADAEGLTGLLRVETEDRPARLLRVAGPPWRVEAMTVVDASGGELASVTLGGHELQRGVLLPATLQVALPEEGIAVDVKLRDLVPNVDNLTDDDFTFQWDSDGE